MITMQDLPFGEVGSPATEYTCTEEVMLDDSAFSNKKPQVAAVGDVLTLRHCENFGLVKHPVHGLFRY